MAQSSIVTGGVTITTASIVPVVTWMFSGFPQPVPESVTWLIAALILTIGHAGYNLATNWMAANGISRLIEDPAPAAPATTTEGAAQ